MLELWYEICLPDEGENTTKRAAEFLNTTHVSSGDDSVMVENSTLEVTKNTSVNTQGSATNVTVVSEAALATVGPVSVVIDASGESFQAFTTYNSACSQTTVNHAVLAVGYGQMQEGQEYYIVKKSWSTGWGDNGYILMARDMQNHCGIASFATIKQFEMARNYELCL